MRENMKRKIDINFDWRYSPKFEESYISPSNDGSSNDDSSFETVNIPHTNIEVPYNNFDEGMYQFESCYRKKIWIDKLDQDEQVYVKFNGVMSYAKVYLNGILVGEHKGGYTPFHINLTVAAGQGENNLLTVYVDSSERTDIPPFGFVVDYLTYGGIYREVSLEYCNNVRLDAVCVKTKDVLTQKPYLDIDLYTYNDSGNSKELTCKFDLIYQNQCIKTFSKVINISNQRKERINIKEEVRGINLWSIDAPNLYHINMQIIKEERIIDTHKIRFGFREAKFTEEGFYLNGKKVKIQGLNRHQSFPYVGYAMPKSAQYKDAEILKYELGVNTVRLSHYPQSDHFMDRCDELGILVFDEIPGWQHIGDEAWQDIAVQHVDEMIMKDFNHPSVIIWGVRINESRDHDELYKRTNSLARTLDDSRSTGGVRCITKSHLLEDVYTYNDFIHKGDNRGLQKKKKVTRSDKPYLITEYNGHMYPTKKFDDEVHRVEHAIRHLNVLDAMHGDDKISGAIGWCMFDYNTHKDFGSGDRICYHGVMDMFRIPKHAAFVYASQQEKTPVMHVASPLCIGEFEGSMLNDIYVFTNCDYVKLYKNGDYISKFYPRKDLYPHVKHPPIIIDDFLGDAIKENERFSSRDAQLIKKMLIKVSKSNGNLGLIDTLKMGWIFLKYKMNMLDAEDLYTKYFGGWGGKATNYVFEGYIGEQCVVNNNRSQIFNPILKVEVDNNILVEEATYDTTRIVLRLLDDNGNDIIYANDAVMIETKGPIEVIGPKIISLVGGSVGFWIKSVGRAGEGQVIIKSERFGVTAETIIITK
jgi:beta-galactosidase